MEKQAKINYLLYRKFSVIAGAAISLGVFQILLFMLYKGKDNLLAETFSNAGLFFRRIIVDRMLIESISIVLVFLLTKWLAKYIGLEYPDSLSKKAKYYLRYLPIVLLSLAVFVFLAIFIRHLWRYDFVIHNKILVSNYGNFWGIYLQSLLPFMAITYAVLTLNLFLQRPKDSKRIPPAANEPQKQQAMTMEFLEVINENGKTLIKTANIEWIEKKSRTCIVKTADRDYLMRKTIRELEDSLKPHGFIRINRRVLVNKTCVHNYSFWEHDKFILRMKGPEQAEFLVSRERMKQIKNQLADNTLLQ